ncbi:hypothetical protein BUALT_Bualt14G0032900 [Buddleja alternifolia]|uniref:Uncharacterized protein n=1 Tax=Buddleja alternifolia TaxID=168488 RepID=A0AAV6WRT5_9LAMI|nr:hypothetical protein BUALT_Bualt14G0032900 [Buddleja alternifolia]
MSEQSFFIPSQTIDLNSARSRIAELGNVEGFSEHGTEEEEKLLNHVSRELESKANQMFSECRLNLSSVPNEDLNELFWQLKKELGDVEGQNAKIEREIDELERRCVEDHDKLESELEKLSCSLEFIESQTPEKAKKDTQIDVSSADHQTDFSNAQCSKFKMLELSHQIEENKTTLKSLQDLDSIYKRFETVERIENALTGLRVIEIEGDSIRLSLKTYIPDLENVLRQQDIEGVIEPLELNHELMIGTVDGTWELKNVEIFPNDVYIGEIIDAAKSFRQLYPTFTVIETRSSLEWFVRRVQDRVALSSLRQLVVKNANKSRHSFEYLDREDIIVAHVVGGVDAFIKLPQGWPLSDSGLELISLKSTTHYSKEISLSFLCKIVEVANSLNANLRQKISSFADSIEEILMQEMRAELHSDSTTAN